MLAVGAVALGTIWIDSRSPELKLTVLVASLHCVEPVPIVQVTLVSAPALRTVNVQDLLPAPGDAEVRASKFESVPLV